MKSQSMGLPSTVKIKNVLSGIATIRLIKNIEPYEHEDISGYSYDEVEIKLRERANLEEYCQNNFDALYAQGEMEEMSPKVEQARRFLDSTDWIFAKCYELGLDPLVEYSDVIARRGEYRELIKKYE